MKNRWRIVIGSLALACVIGFFVWRPSGPPEPVFEGRTLTSWLEGHLPYVGTQPAYGTPGWKKVDEALLSIGTNAIPTLLKMIRAKGPPPLVLKAIDATRRHGWMRINYRYAFSRNDEAAYAFQIFGTNAVNAVPALIEIYEKNISPSSQRCAAQALGHIGHGAEAALPALIRNFTDTNSQVRFEAVSAVMYIRGKPDVVVPALTSALKDPNVNVRWNALAGLDMFGSASRPAVPEILKMLDDPGMVGTSSITQEVASALWQIAPETIGKPFVVEDATPMIANEMTSEGLMITLHGEHRTLIPPGKHVPAVAQLWSSDPGPQLTLYRGVPGQPGNEHLLGQFEVMEVPMAGDINISTLCVVANGKIILCARDNTAQRFLEIRRIENQSVK